MSPCQLRGVSPTFSFKFNYTYSHALDYLSNGGIGLAFQGPFNSALDLSILNPQNPFNVRQNMYGNADYDIRHYLSMNYTYTTPKKMFHNILGGWTLGGTLFWHTGLPVTIIDTSTGGVLSGFGYGTTTTGVLPGGVNGILGTFANQIAGSGSIMCRSEFADPKVGPCPGVVYNFAKDMNGFGNQRRNQVFGPHFFDTDLTVAKTFHIPGWEQGQLGFGVTAYNLFDHPNFAQPVNDVAASNVGAIQTTVSAPTSICGSLLGADASPRLLQTQIKLTF